MPLSSLLMSLPLPLLSLSLSLSSSLLSPPLLLRERRHSRPSMFVAVLSIYCATPHIKSYYSINGELIKTNHYGPPPSLFFISIHTC